MNDDQTVPVVAVSTTGGRHRAPNAKDAAVRSIFAMRDEYLPGVPVGQRLASDRVGQAVGFRPSFFGSAR